MLCLLYAHKHVCKFSIYILASCSPYRNIRTTSWSPAQYLISIPSAFPERTKQILSNSITQVWKRSGHNGLDTSLPTRTWVALTRRKGIISLRQAVYSSLFNPSTSMERSKWEFSRQLHLPDIWKMALRVTFWILATFPQKWGKSSGTEIEMWEERNNSEKAVWVKEQPNCWGLKINAFCIREIYPFMSWSTVV